jgi:hypothetical protein
LLSVGEDLGRELCFELFFLFDLFFYIEVGFLGLLSKLLLGMTTQVAAHGEIFAHEDLTAFVLRAFMPAFFPMLRVWHFVGRVR